MPPEKTYGQIAFEAYNEAKGGVTYDGKPIPPWANVGDEVRAAWEAAAIAVSTVVHEALVTAIRSSGGTRNTRRRLRAIVG